jgi:hypothetical protein
VFHAWSVHRRQWKGNTVPGGVIGPLCTYVLTHGAEPFLRDRQLCSHSRTSQHSMEPEGSIPCSQTPSTDPSSEPDQANPSHPISLRSILILSTHLRFGLPSGLFLTFHQYPTCIPLLSHSCYMPRPSHSS